MAFDTQRSNRAEVRNPILTLPSAKRLLAASPEVRDLLDEVLRDLAADARARAEKSWRTNKGPMAAYWKAVGAYTKHIRAAVRRAGRAP